MNRFSHLSCDYEHFLFLSLKYVTALVFFYNFPNFYLTSFTSIFSPFFIILFILIL
eukprot:UN23719